MIKKFLGTTKLVGAQKFLVEENWGGTTPECPP